MLRSTHSSLAVACIALTVLGAVLSAVCSGVPARADTAPGVVLPPTARAIEAVRGKVVRGRVLLDTGDRSSIAVLRAAAQESTAPLASIVGPNTFASPPPNETLDELSADVITGAAQAHYWWGMAAEHFGLHEESIIALARATRLSNRVRVPGSILERDALLSLRGALRKGLPLVAADDTFDAIAEIAHGNLWSPRRIRFDYSNVAFEPASGKAAQPSQVRELLITSGKLFPPQESELNVNAGMSRIPPLYRVVDPLRLPPVLQLDKMVMGYARETSGPNRGLWRQVVRVYYASPFLTKDSRDDLPRAEALCEQLLKIHTLVRAGLGLENAYTSDGVTTLWLSEVSSWWPLDDDDPAIRASLPPLTKVNTPLNAKEKLEVSEVETTPLWQPWRAAGQIASAPGEIMYFKMTEPRSESEWLRETVHEYGHIALPPFDGFRPPLEPFANGLMGETLAMLWAAAAPDSLATQPPVGSIMPVTGAAPPTLSRDFAAHVAREAIPALRLWNAQGPSSPLRRDGTSQGLRYLQGLTVHLERVYGARILGAALRPLATRTKAAADRNVPLTSLNAESLLGSLPDAMRDPFGATGVLPIWLPGALQAASPDSATAPIINREPLRLRGRERASGWLFIPPTAASLHIDWKDARATTAGSPPALQVEGGGKAATAVPRSPDSSKAVRIDVSTLSGWQRFSFVPSADLLLTGAYFERRK